MCLFPDKSSIELFHYILSDELMEKIVEYTNERIEVEYNIRYWFTVFEMTQLIDNSQLIIENIQLENEMKETQKQIEEKKPVKSTSSKKSKKTKKKKKE